MYSKSIEIFVQTMLCRNETDNVSVAELYDAYTEFCSNRRWSPVKEQDFESTSRHIIHSVWGIFRRNDIQRVANQGLSENSPSKKQTEPKTKAVRGYHGLALINSQQGPQESDWIQ